MRPQSLLPLLALGHAARAVAAVPGYGISSRELEELNDLEARGLIDDIWNKLKNSATCAGCEGILVLLKGLTALGDRPFVKVIQGICKLAKVQDDDVCDGAVALEGPIIAADIRNMDIGSRTSKAFCTTFFGLCGYPEVAAWNVPFPSPKPSRSRPKPSGKDPIKIVHYSDIHIDPLYVPGSSTECKKPICCRPYTDADKPGNSKSPAGPNGDHKCDAPISLEESMYRAINQIVPDAAFTIFTGDVVDHAIWNTSKPYNEQSIELAYASMNQTLKLVYGTAGNHEAHPVNSFQPNAVGQDAQWVYSLLSTEWSHWIDQAAAANAGKIGTYSTKYPKGNLRIISLNTNIYYRHNSWMYQNYDDKDPNLQIAWLVNELDAAEKAGENVYIIGHMPLGEKDALPDGSNYLDQVVNRYSSTIAAMFYGHTHVDHFEISYADYNARSAANALMTSYIAPSLTPTSGMPSFRVYEVDPETFGVLDATTYLADMTNAAFQTSGPVWTKFYSAKEAYGQAVSPPVTDAKAELTPAFWHQVTERFEADSGLFDAYISRKSRGWNVAKCDGGCKTDELCQIRAARAQNNCFKLQPGVHLDRRDGAVDEHGEHDECGVPVTLQAFSALTDSKENLQKLQDMIDEETAKAANTGKL
ncbi:Sphingomyelin phosphodiesterase [Tolypocladium ophioglossoides CBS 100239]|uniref:Sphingomyelin phosphodiesterase n=1 Tax=Tolypocladium ophioglossoides (strain CBS 100239) TaxID=1163406 RepID=A0A0L0NJS1_TOLOC|nr:Sphingomyelin phosphodiesterase [Tolypocladium ophioglossoides CBS 100239]